MILEVLVMKEIAWEMCAEGKEEDLRTVSWETLAFKDKPRKRSQQRDWWKAWPYVLVCQWLVLLYACCVHMTVYSAPFTFSSPISFLLAAAWGVLSAPRGHPRVLTTCSIHWRSHNIHICIFKLTYSRYLPQLEHKLYEGPDLCGFSLASKTMLDTQ